MDVYNSGSGTGKGRALLVFVAVCLQGALVYSCSVLASPFYVTHLVNRGEYQIEEQRHVCLIVIQL